MGRHPPNTPHHPTPPNTQVLNLENYQNQWGDVAHNLGWGAGTFYVVWILIGEWAQHCLGEMWRESVDSGLGGGHFLRGVDPHR